LPVELKSQSKVGDYHIHATDLSEALDPVQGDPEFDYVPLAIIEISQVKTKEAETGFVYPDQY